MAGKSTSSSTPQLNHISVQTSTYGIPLTVGWGTHRRSANLIWYGDFQSHAVKTSSGGKGGSSSSTSYTYTASVIMSLGEGVLASIPTVYKDQQVLVNGSTTALAQAGLNFMSGAQGQSPWGYMTTKHSAQAIGYSCTAYVYASSYALSSSATLPNHSFEVVTNFRATVSGTTIADALPSDIITDFLTNTVYGVPGWPSGLLASLTTYATYCTAANLFLSPVLDSTRNASDFLTEVLDASNSDAVWSSGQLKIIPYGDTAITNNGVTYTPNLTPVYSFTDDDFIVSSDGDDPVKVSLQKLADSYNSVRIEFKDRSGAYNTNMSPALDQASINQYGLRTEDPHSLPCVCDPTVAANLAQLRVQKLANLRRTFSFDLDQRYCLLEPMDLVTLTSGDLSAVLVRVVTVNEASDGQLSVVAEEMLVGSGAAPAITRQSYAGYVNNTALAPGHVTSAIMINPPHGLTNGDTQVWIGVAGGANWGGCDVYVSLDNSYFEYQGAITNPVRYGTLTSALPSGSDPDTTHTFGVDLTSSLGALATSTSAAADAAASLCLVDNELLSYQTATLTSAYNYNVGTYLRRGQFSTTIASHAIGAPFARLDQGIFKYSFNSAQAGKTIYVKFQSFNQWGNALEDLSTVSTYTVTLSSSSGGTTATWSTLIGMPANVAALSGTEAIQNSLLPSGTGNRVILSQMEKGTTGWTLATISGAPSPGLGVQTASGLSGIQCAFTATASGQSANTIASNSFAVTAGEWLAISALFSTTAYATAQFEIEYYGSSGFLSDVSLGASVPTSSYLTLREAIVQVPTGAVRAAIWFSTNSTAAGVAGCSMYTPMVQGVPAGQTTYPAFTPGPISTPGADVTASNTAAAIAGQTSWATYGALQPSNVAAPGANLVYDGGLSLKATTWGLGSWYWYIGADIGNYVACNVSGNFANSARFPVTASLVYTIQTYAATNSSATSTPPQFYIAWYNSSDVYISETSHANIGTSYALNSVTGTAPSGATYGRAILYSNTLSSGAYVWVSKVKVEWGSTATPFNDTATSGALYATGVTIDSLKPAQANADVTGTNTAAAIYSQGPLATSGLTPTQVTNSNISITSGGVLSGAGGGSVTIGGLGYTGALNATYGATTSTNLYSGTYGTLADSSIVTSIGTASGISGQSSWATYSTLTPTQLTQASSNLIYNPTALLGNQGWTQNSSAALYPQQGGSEGYFWDSNSATNSTGLWYYQQSIPIYAGGAYSLQAWIYAGGLTMTSGTFVQARVYVEWLDSSHSHLGYSGVCAAGAGASWTYCTQPYQIAPTGTAYARVSIDIYGDGTWTNSNCAWKKIKLEANSVCTPFSDDATYGASYQNGTLIDSLQPAQSGADVTSTHTASAVSGQSSLATFTPPYYAGNAAAITGGLANGALFTDTSNSYVVTAVHTGVGAPKIASGNGTGNITYASPNTSAHVAFTGLTANGIWSFYGVWTAQSSSTPYSGISSASGTWALVETLTSGGSAHTIFSGTWASGTYNSGAPGINFSPDTTFGSTLTMSGASIASTLSGSVTVTLQLQITSASGSMASITNGIAISVQWTPTQ